MPKLTIAELLDEEEDKAPPWLVPNFICQSHMVVLAGEPGAGKSLVSYTLALAKASGGEFLGSALNPAPVLYFDEENAIPDVKQYLRWSWRGLGRPDVNLVAQNLNLEHFSLSSAGSARYLYMRELAAKIKPSLIVIDTATPACAIKDENSNGEASAAIQELRKVRAAGGPATTMFILKHAKLDSEGGVWHVRGAKDWVGATDSTLMHTKQAGHPREDGWHNTRIRAPKRRAFGLRGVLKITPVLSGEDGNIGVHLQSELIPDKGDDQIISKSLSGKRKG